MKQGRDVGYNNVNSRGESEFSVTGKRQNSKCRCERTGQRSGCGGNWRKVGDRKEGIKLRRRLRLGVKCVSGLLSVMQVWLGWGGWTGVLF